MYQIFIYRVFKKVKHIFLKGFNVCLHQSIYTQREADPWWNPVGSLPVMTN